MIRLLAFLCGLLVAVIGVEVWAYAAGDRGVPEAVPARAAHTPRSQRVSEGKGGNDRWLADVLARPLFAPDRRPAAGAESTDPTLPRLAGIIGSADGMVAIFQPDGEGKRTVAHNGQRVAGWVVATIAPDRVYLEKSGERVVLTPRFAPAPVPASPARIGLPLRR